MDFKSKAAAPLQVPQDKLFIKVRDIITAELGVDENDVTPAARFIEDLGADSIDMVELLMCFEDTFEVIITDNAADDILTVQNAVDYLRGKAKAA